MLLTRVCFDQRHQFVGSGSREERQLVWPVLVGVSVGVCVSISVSISVGVGFGVEVCCFPSNGRG